MNSPELKQQLCRVVIEHADKLHATGNEVIMASKAMVDPKAISSQRMSLSGENYPTRCIEYIFNNFYLLAKDHGLIS